MQNCECPFQSAAELDRLAPWNQYWYDVIRINRTTIDEGRVKVGEREVRLASSELSLRVGYGRFAFGWLYRHPAHVQQNGDSDRRITVWDYAPLLRLLKLGLVLILIRRLSR